MGLAQGERSCSPSCSRPHTHPTVPVLTLPQPWPARPQCCKFSGQRLIFPDFFGISPSSAVLEGLSALLQILSPCMFPISKVISPHHLHKHREPPDPSEPWPLLGCKGRCSLCKTCLVPCQQPLIVSSVPIFEVGIKIIYFTGLFEDFT